MTPKIALIVSPFHVGLHRHRVGKGPERILAKLQPVLVSKGISHRVVTIDKVDDYEGEIGRSFEVLRRIAEETKKPLTKTNSPSSSLATATLRPLLLLVSTLPVSTSTRLMSSGLMPTPMHRSQTIIQTAISTAWVVQCWQGCVGNITCRRSISIHLYPFPTSPLLG